MKRTILLALFIPLIGGATTITIIPADSITAAEGDVNTWAAANFPATATPTIVATFESNTYGPWNQLATGAGTFIAEPGGLGSDMSGTGTNQFTILDAADTPFNGRYNTTPGGQNWLDSNDITDLGLNTSLSNLYFSSPTSTTPAAC